jgi:hypothetical protein
MLKLATGNAKRVINLDGPEGNAYALLGIAQGHFRQMKTNPKPYLDEMRSGDYFNLVATFDKYFGGVYTITTTNEEMLTSIKNARS